MLKKLFLIVASVFVMNPIYADTTYVYCATQEKKWDWLTENGNYVSVRGEWETTITYNKDSCYVFTNYFKITDGTKVVDLESKCRERFGNSYLYAQPSDNRFNRWHVFGEDEKIRYYGIFSMQILCDDLT